MSSAPPTLGSLSLRSLGSLAFAAMLATGTTACGGAVAPDDAPSDAGAATHDVGSPTPRDAGSATPDAGGDRPDAQSLADAGQTPAPDFTWLPDVPFQHPTETVDHPRAGLRASPRRLIVSLDDDAIRADYDRIVDTSECEVVGTFPIGGGFVLDCGQASTIDTLEALSTRLASQVGVAATSLDIGLEGMTVPPPYLPFAVNSGVVDPWTYLEPPGQGGTWGMERIGAPQIWSLRAALERDGQAPSVPVSVIEFGFWSHDDFGPDFTVTPDHGSSRDEDRNHGAAVVSIIGALHNGELADGVSPYARITGISSTAQATAIAASSTFLQAMHTAAGLQTRIIATSTGLKTEDYCSGLTCASPGRCAPAATAIALDAGAAVLAVQLPRLLTEAGDALLVGPAGNASGQLDPGPGFCTPVPECLPTGDPGCRPGRVLRAGTSSLLARASAFDPGLAASVIVVEAVNPDGRRSPRSNVDADVFAPTLNGAAWGGPDAVAVDNFSGASAAAPMVAGAAAMLLAIEPTLSAGELKLLLTQAPFAAAFDGEESATDSELDLLSAAIGIDDLRPGRPLTVAQMLADMDDGTPDGFQRVIRDQWGHRLGPHTDDARGDGVVDMRDFRRLRDTHIMCQQPSFLGAGPEDPKTDLNDNGVLDHSGDQGNIARERFPRARLVHGGGCDMHETQPILTSESSSLQLLTNVFEPGPFEHWTDADLATLMESADLHIMGTNALITELGAQALEIVSVTGPSEFGITSAEGLENVMIPAGEDEVVLTTPILQLPVLTWRPICGATSVPGRSLMIPQSVGVGDDYILDLFDGSCMDRCDGTSTCPAPDPGPPMSPDPFTGPLEPDPNFPGAARRAEIEIIESVDTVNGTSASRRSAYDYTWGPNVRRRIITIASTSANGTTTSGRTITEYVGAVDCLWRETSMSGTNCVNVVDYVSPPRWVGGDHCFNGVAHFGNSATYEHVTVTNVGTRTTRHTCRGRCTSAWDPRRTCP